MRTKRSARGRFHGSFLGSDSSTVARPLPPPITDNISDGNWSSEDWTGIYSSTESDDNVSGFSGDEKINDFYEKTCLECNRGKHLLICCGIDCPIAIHEKCMLDEPKYDEEGKFHCPYCWYKLQKARMEELRRKVMLAKKDVDSFLNFRPQVARGDKEKQDNMRAKGKVLNVRQIIGETEQFEHVNGMDVDDEVNNGAWEVEEDHQHSDHNREVAECVKIPVTLARGIVVDEAGVEEGKNDQQGNDERYEGTNADEEHAETLTAQCVAEKTLVHCGFQGSQGAKCETSNTSGRGDQVSMEKGEQMNKGATTANVLCTSEDGALSGPESVDSEIEKYAVRLRHVKRINSQKADSPNKSIVLSHTSSTTATRKRIEEFARNQVCMEKGEQMNKCVSTTTANVFTSEDGALSGPEAADSETEKYVVQLRHVERINSQKADSPKKPTVLSRTSSTKATRKRIEEFAPLKKPKQSEMPTRFIEPPCTQEKRKRFFWKPEEEEILREGVRQFSTTVNKNLPWRKILEFGCHIFHPSRNPGDLKSKWKNIMSKES